MRFEPARRRLLSLTAASALWPRLVNAQAAAQSDFPRPGMNMRYIVPFAPGGLTDVMARLVGQQLASRWGISVVVDNKAGGSGQIGADIAAKAPGDGQTLLAITLKAWPICGRLPVSTKKLRASKPNCEPINAVTSNSTTSASIAPLGLVAEPIGSIEVPDALLASWQT